MPTSYDQFATLRDGVRQEGASNSSNFMRPHGEIKERGRTDCYIFGGKRDSFALSRFTTSIIRSFASELSRSIEIAVLECRATVRSSSNIVGFSLYFVTLYKTNISKIIQIWKWDKLRPGWHFVHYCIFVCYSDWNTNASKLLNNKIYFLIEFTVVIFAPLNRKNIGKGKRSIVRNPDDNFQK